jgi:hypothetical protein
LEVAPATTDDVEVPEPHQETAVTSQAPAPSSGPSSLAFTIDFGQEDGKPQITDRWTHPTPFRGRAGMQRRPTANEAKNVNKERSATAGEVKTVKVSYLVLKPVTEIQLSIRWVGLRTLCVVFLPA